MMTRTKSRKARRARPTAKERSVVFFPSYYEAIKDLDDATRLLMYDQIIAYGLYGELLELTPIAKALFTLVKPNIDSSIKKWEKAKENGEKPPAEGSNPRGRPPKKNQAENQTENQTKNHDKEKDKEKDKDYERERASEKEKGAGEGKTLNYDLLF